MQENIKIKNIIYDYMIKICKRVCIAKIFISANLLTYIKNNNNKFILYSYLI